MLRRILCLCLFALPFAAAPRAQDGAPALAIGSERFPVRVTTLGLYQSYESDESDLSEVTLPLSVSVPAGRNLALSLRASYVAADGNAPEGVGEESAALGSVSGLADAQLALSYYRPFGTASVVASLSVNVPSGQRALTAAEAQTAFFLGQGFYGFYLPSLGQGLNVAPALTWAIPLGDHLAAGLGVAYQVRGGFEPRAATDGAEPPEYDPGDELLLTAGLDYRFGEEARLSLDGTYAFYGTDTFAGMEFETGDAFSLTVQWSAPVRRHEARVLARFRSKGKSTFPEVDGVVLGADAVVPTSGRLQGRMRFRLSPRVHLGTLAQGRYYAASDLFSEKAVVDVGLSPEFEVARGLTLLLRSSVTAGDLTGFSVGGGFAWTR